MGRRRRSLLDSRGSIGGSPRIEDVLTADQTADLEAALSRSGASGNTTPAGDDEPSDIEVPIAALSPAPLRLSQVPLREPPPRDNSAIGSTAYPAPVPIHPANIGSENVLRGILANDSLEPMSIDDALRRDARIPSPAPDLEPSPSILPPKGTTKSLEGYERPRAQAVDAPVARDLFGEGPGYDDFESAAPPTDEFPARVLEDVSQPYVTPYTVPEPPPIPGILDRFTPPPTHRSDIGSRRKKPEYLAETPQSKGHYKPTPSPDKRQITPRTEEQRREDPPGMSPIALGIGIVSVLFVVGAMVALVIAIMIAFSSRGNEETDGLNREPVSGGVEIREGVGLPEDVTDTTPPTNTLPVPPPIGDPSIPVPVPAIPKIPATAKPEPEPEPEPVVPTPPPQPAPAIDKGTLKIRSNRRVLVKIDGEAIGYTPREVQRPPGTYTILVQMPGQPNTKQSRQATIDNEHPNVIVDFSF